jgi:hypothetical protein
VNLHDHLDKVVDRGTFLIFVQALIDDRLGEVAKEKEKPYDPYGPGANGWENGKIEDFLFAALRWEEDSLDREGGLPQQPSWHAFAAFLYCGKIYE